MTKTMTREHATSDLFTPQEAANLPVEVRREIEQLAESPPARPRILAIVAAQDVEAAQALALKLQDASLRLTYPEDWIVFRAKDGAELGYLEDVGCQRVRPLWAISFEKVDLTRDVVEETLPSDGEDTDVAISVVVQGECSLTGEVQMESGFRSSAGFYGPAWRGSKNKPVERAKVRADIRKAAIANGRGRLIRLFTGLGQVPVERLIRAGLDPKRLRGVRFESGTKGGSGQGSGASDPQINAICKQSFGLSKVANLGAHVGEQKLIEMVRGAGLTFEAASSLISKLSKVERGGMSLDEFGRAIGVQFEAPEPGSEG